jgi:hypothetical protein
VVQVSLMVHKVLAEEVAGVVRSGQAQNVATSAEFTKTQVSPGIMVAMAVHHAPHYMMAKMVTLARPSFASLEQMEQFRCIPVCINSR